MNPEIKKEINIRCIRIIVKRNQGPNSDILGFAELELVDASGLVVFKVKGFVIKRKTFGSTEVIVLNPPAHPTAHKLLCSFYIESKDLWKEIEAAAVSEVQRLKEEEITPEDVDSIFNDEKQ